MEGKMKRVVTCKQCESLPTFSNVSLLRQHQWKEHRDTYANVGRQVAKIPKAKPQTLDIKKELTVRELIAKLEERQGFMTDVIMFLKGSL